MQPISEGLAIARSEGASDDLPTLAVADEATPPIRATTLCDGDTVPHAKEAALAARFS
jgi:hypothetical protein